MNPVANNTTDFFSIPYEAQQPSKRQRIGAFDEVHEELHVERSKTAELLSSRMVREEERTGYFRVIFDSEKIYEGEFVNGLPEGHGTFYDSNGQLMHEGEYLKGMKHGLGKAYSKVGLVEYDGGYCQDLYHGPGISYDKEGEVEHDGYWQFGGKYLGEIKNDLPEGEGTAFTPNGEMVYSGEWYHGVPHGAGKQYSKDHYFEGRFLNGCKEGPGTVYWKISGKPAVTGTWRRSMQDGEMTYYDRKGNEISHVLFRNGKRVPASI